MFAQVPLSLYHLQFLQVTPNVGIVLNVSTPGDLNIFHILEHAQTYLYSCNVIYAIRCPCGMLYVGETSRELKTRICEHRSAVAQHFKENSHSICEFFYFGIEQVHSVGQGGDIVVKLKSRENFWIFTLDTLFPRGLNQ